MARQIARREAPDDLKSFEYARSDGTIRTMHPREGFLSPQDGEDDAALEAAGFAQHSDDVKEISEREDAALEAEAEKAEEQREEQAEAVEEAAQARSGANSESEEGANSESEEGANSESEEGANSESEEGANSESEEGAK